MIKPSRSARTITVSQVDGYDMTIDADSWPVTPDMKLSPNVGSDRSWVWNVAADVSEGEPEAQTLAIRFGNSESMLTSQTDVQVPMLTNHRCQPLQGSLHQSSAGERGLVQVIGSRERASSSTCQHWAYQHSTFPLTMWNKSWHRCRCTLIGLLSMS